MYEVFQVKALQNLEMNNLCHCDTEHIKMLKKLLQH